MNRARDHQKISVTWAQMGLHGTQPVRDLWMRRPMGTLRGLSAVVPGHGAMLFKIGRPRG